MLQKLIRFRVKLIIWFYEHRGGSFLLFNRLFINRHFPGDVTPIIDGNSTNNSMPNLRSVMTPTALLPSAFPVEQFQMASSVQQLFNELYFRVSLDHGFLLNAFQEVIKGDPFMKRLVGIMQKVYEEGIHQKLTLALQRSDYMCQRDELSNELEIKQVRFLL